MIRRIANNGDFMDIFGLSNASKKVLIDILTHGVSLVADISARLNMPKSSVYDAVVPLLENSLVNEYSDDRGKTFGISDKDQLTRAHEQRLAELKSAQSSLLELINTHHTDDNVARPKIKFYVGTLGIKQAFRDMMWNKEITETFLMWPVKEMIDIDEDFFKWHGKQRFKYNVMLNCIEKHGDRILQKKKDWLKNDARTNLARIRYLPKGTDWKMSFWIYGNKCLFASGGREKIAFTIHSKEFCQMMMLLWKSMWKNSLP